MTTLVAPAPVLPAAPTAHVAPQRFSRLTRVELRKMLDTRAGIAVPAITLLAMAGVLTYLVIRGGDASWARLSGPIAFFSVFFPVIPLLGMASEWTTRTALPTFTLTPRRGRVILAKVIASVAIAAVLFAATIGLIAAAVGIAGMVSGNGADFTGTGTAVRSLAVQVAIQTGMALGFGLLLQHTAAALAAYFPAPTLVALISQELLSPTVGPWFDVFGAATRLGAGDFSQLGQTVVALTIWVVLPLTAGVVRSLRREVK